jgi:Uma2 family endonuclease
MAATLPIRITYEEFRAFPDDGRRHELIDGEVFSWRPPWLAHQLVSGECLSLLYYAVTKRDLGWVLPAPLEVKFAGDSSVQPDLVVVLRDRSHVLTEPRIEGAPSLLVEITSPETYAHDLGRKFALYARNGVPEYWIVDPDAETIAIHELRDGQYTALPNDGIARSLVIPNLVVDVRALFAAARFSV